MSIDFQVRVLVRTKLGQCSAEVPRKSSLRRRDDETRLQQDFVPVSVGKVAGHKGSVNTTDGER